MPTPETLKALTTASVLLALVLLMGIAWVRDRNARIADLRSRIVDLKDQIVDWREVARENEKSRELDREISRQQIEAMKTAEAVIIGLRDAFERRERESR